MATLTVNPIDENNTSRNNYFGDTWKPAYSSGANGDEIRARSEKRGSSPIYEIIRGAMAFNTSTLPDNAIISSVVLRLYCVSADNNLGNGAVYIVPTNQGSTGATFTITNLGNLAHASITASAYNNFTLNATGISQVSKTGNTYLGTIEYYDFANVAPGSVTANSYIFSDSNQANKPELVITYSLPAGFLAFL